MYLDNGTFMMKAVAQSGSIGCNYYISASKQVGKSLESYVGKLRSDFAGSIYTLYDDGFS